MRKMYDVFVTLFWSFFIIALGLVLFPIYWLISLHKQVPGYAYLREEYGTAVVSVNPSDPDAYQYVRWNNREQGPPIIFFSEAIGGIMLYCLIQGRIRGSRE